MKKRNYQSEAGLFATLIALGSFAMGTLIVVLRILLPTNDYIIDAGFYYILIAALAHAITMLCLLYYCLIRNDYRDYYSRKIFLLLCNVPVAALYTHLAF